MKSLKSLSKEAALSRKEDALLKSEFTSPLSGFSKKKPPASAAKERAKEKREVGSKVDSSKPSAEIPDTVSSSATDSKRSKVTFRDKFNTCSFCEAPISDRIRICSGCRKVCYCNSRCQKSHWKTHKRNCVYALSKDQKETTG